MLNHSLCNWTFKLCCTFFILPLFLCHTVTEDYDTTTSNAFQNYPRPKRNEIKTISIEDVKRTPSPPVADSNATAEISAVNKTIPPQNFNITQSLPNWMDTIKSGALERTGLVVLGFMSIIVVFFVVRAIRLRHKKSKSRKYGIITSTEMEMEPLDNDDDDEEDTTLFDAQHKYSMP